MSRFYEELPENLNDLNDKELEKLAQDIWHRIIIQQKSIDRQTLLGLRQRAYSIWIELYPNESDDDADCHLEGIYLQLLSSYNSNL